MTAYPISKAAFAELAGVSRAAISNAIRRGTLVHALVGHRIDLASRAALEYLASQPFPRDESGEVDPEDVPEGFTSPWFDPVLMRAVLARAHGVIATDEQVADVWLREITNEDGMVEWCERLESFFQGGGYLTVTNDGTIVDVEFLGFGKGGFCYQDPKVQAAALKAIAVKAKSSSSRRSRRRNNSARRGRTETST